jgi:hypothetical protein
MLQEAPETTPAIEPYMTAEKAAELLRLMWCRGLGVFATDDMNALLLGIRALQKAGKPRHVR